MVCAKQVFEIEKSFGKMGWVGSEISFSLVFFLLFSVYSLLFLFIFLFCFVFICLPIFYLLYYFVLFCLFFFQPYFSQFLWKYFITFLKLSLCNVLCLYHSIAIEARVLEMGFGVLIVIGKEFFYIRDVNDGN